jgi:hypothetical protein
MSIWSTSPIAANGVLIVIGQVLHNADNSVAPENGKVLFVNPLLDGTGPWTAVPSPIQIPDAYDNYCPNYSSALVPVRDGGALLELASDYRAVNQCGSYFETKTWNDLIVPEANSTPTKH